MPREKNKKFDELAQMVSAITHWVEEDIVTRVKLIAQVNQILAPNPNLNEEVN